MYYLIQVEPNILRTGKELRLFKFTFINGFLKGYFGNLAPALFI
jgi:hypothetical protein